jgi:uncharacterized membrane protein YgcG
MHWVLSIFAWLLAPLAMLPALPPVSGGGVRDQGKFFSLDAITSADRVIDQVRDDEQRDVLIETVPDVPQELRDQLADRGKAKFFADWAESRARERGISGVYILICKDPAHLQVAVGNVTRQKLFTTADRDELAQIMLRKFRQKQFDQGLLDAVNFIQRQMKAHGPAPDGSIDASGPMAVRLAQIRSNLLTCFGDSQ